MGGGASKSKTDLSVPGGHHNSIHSRERRMSHIETNPPPQSEKLVKCPHCDRNFAEDRVDRHVDVCGNIQSKKREPFDVAEQRIEGTVAADYKDQMTDVEKKENPGEWRKQREEMIKSIKEAKKSTRPGTASAAGEPQIEFRG